MRRHAKSTFICGAVVIVLLIPAQFVAAQDSLTAARNLYLAAAYDDALTMLNRLRAGDYSQSDNRSMGLYRTLCLMALGRTTEAVAEVEAIVTQDPSYLPSASDVPPRVRSLFGDTRRRMLPAIIQRQYLQARGAWDRQEFAVAEAGFRAVVEGLDDPDLAPVANQPPLADLRILAAGFRDLGLRVVSPPSLQAPAAATTTAATTTAPTAPPASPSDRIFSVDDADVATPLVLQQSIPAVPRKLVVQTPVAVEVIIDEAGSVESAAMKISTNTPYDQVVLAAAHKWRYQPATLQGVPVKYRKIVTISFSPSR